MSWEYKTLKLGTKGFLGGKVNEVELEKALNELGRLDWELVNVFTTNQAQGQSRDVGPTGQFLILESHFPAAFRRRYRS